MGDAAIAYVVAYLEVAPAAATEVRGLLGAFRDAGRRADGNLRFDALHRSERPNHFAIVEAWTTVAAQEAHARAPQTRSLGERLERHLVTAYDERPHIALSVGPAPAAPAGRDAVWVVTHVDVVPTFKDQGAGILTQLAEASRKDPGNVRFDALTQRSRHNHMTVVETWQDRRAFDAHVVASHVKQFREALTPMSGSLYDERLYSAID